VETVLDSQLPFELACARNMSRSLDSILLGDCREVLKKLPGDSVDLVVTSTQFSDKSSKVYGGGSTPYDSNLTYHDTRQEAKKS
jgi:hypothetical protein